MTEKQLPKPPHELNNMWYSILNHVNPEDVLIAFRIITGLALDDGYNVESLTRQSEDAGGITRAMCYDALVKSGQEITPEQEHYLKEFPWQEQFWQ